MEMLDALAGGVLLRLGLEKELVDLAHGQTLGEVIKGAVFGPAVMALALSFATPSKTLDDRGAEQVRGNIQLLQEKAFALAQGQGGLAGVVEYPRHVYGEDRKTGGRRQQKETALRMRKCLTP